MDRGTQGRRLWNLAFVGMEAITMLLITTACGGGGSQEFGTTNTSTVAGSLTINWDANHEKSVNAPGGGYLVYFANAPGVNTTSASNVVVPYVSGAQAPTSVTLSSLTPGTYYFRVVAYTSFNPPNGGFTRRSPDSAETSVQFP
jgi:hypothetical protein